VHLVGFTYYRHRLTQVVATHFIAGLQPTKADNKACFDCSVQL